MKGDFHVRFRENLRVKLPWVTRLWVSFFMIKWSFILLIISGTVHGQIRYRLFEKNHCDDSVRQLFQFYAYKDTSNILSSDILTSELIFSDTGKYHISYLEYFDGLKNYIDFHSVTIDGQSSEISDTIRAGLIDERTYMFDPPFTEYYCCNKKCEGKFTSTYNSYADSFFTVEIFCVRRQLS